MHILKQLNQLFSNTIYLSFEKWPDVSAEVKKENTEKPLNSTEQKIQDLENKLASLWATEKITKKVKDSLYKWLTWDPSIKNDPEAKPTIEMFKRFEAVYEKAVIESKVSKQELEDLVKMWDKYEFNTWLDNNSWNIKNNEISSEKLKTITNREFLSLDKKERLQYVTKNNVDFSSIVNWSVDNVTFFFDQDGDWKDNSDLYRLTTIGQVMGKEVWEVESNWKVYTRWGIDWEFFNWNNRLIIHTDTEIQINKLRTPDNIKKLNSNVNSRLSEFSIEQQDVAREALERWINNKETIKILSEVLANNKENVSKKVEVEELFTEVERIRDMFWIEITNPKFNELIVDTNWDWKIDGYNNTDLAIVWEWYYDSRENHPSWFEKYKDLVTEITKNYSRISEHDLINLINHENPSWNPNIKAPWSSAYWLWQMINSTWLRYGKWLDRSNPSDQLEASCRYLDAIMTRQNCDIEHAMAYYNTWEGIKNISDSKAREFASINPAIAKHIDWPINANSYFNAAVEYYRA